MDFDAPGQADAGFLSIKTTCFPEKWRDLLFPQYNKYEEACQGLHKNERVFMKFRS